MIKTERDGNDLAGYVGTQWKSVGEKAWEGVYQGRCFILDSSRIRPNTKIPVQVGFEVSKYKQGNGELRQEREESQ